MGNSNSIDSNEAKKLIKQNYFNIILDVRDKDEWNEGHYPTAVHIPLESLEKKFFSKYPKKDIKILIHCRSGMRAKKAEQILNSHGYLNTVVLNDSYDKLM